MANHHILSVLVENKFGVLTRVSSLFSPPAGSGPADLRPCASCGAPTTSPVCAFCSLSARAGAR